MLDIYSRVVNAQAPLSEVLAEQFPWCAEHHEELGGAFRGYCARKRALSVLDLDDLLLYWHALLGDPVSGPAVAGCFEHVLVDEYQDVNALQADIVERLSAGGAGLTVVGDDFQAIYGFRAASARHILDFPERFAGARTITLERNYRSTNPILAVANAVSEQDRRGTRSACGARARAACVPSSCSRAMTPSRHGRCASACQAAREEGMELRAQAVLFRTGHDSDLLELELTRRDIPFVKYGGLRFLDAAHVKDLIALLRLLDNPADELSWFRVLQLFDGVGPTRARRILDALRAPGSAAAGPAAGSPAGPAAGSPAGPGADPVGSPVLARRGEAVALVPEGSRRARPGAS